jgi:transposase
MRDTKKTGIEHTADTPKVADPEVRERPHRRVFTKGYKRRILAEAEAARGTPGGVGALLRREGLYSSHLTEWRKASEQGSGRRGPRGAKAKQQRAELQRLDSDNKRLRRELEQARLVIDVPKKLSRLFDGQSEQRQA